MSDNSKLLKLVQDKINYFDNHYGELVMTPIYFGPNDKLGMALAELAGYLEISSSKYSDHHYSKIHREVTYNEDLCYDNIDPGNLDDYERFCSMFLYF
mgnify:CR=1 FL=1